MPSNVPDWIPAPPVAGARAKPHRGGARPGAGARPGNLNALKHGRYSRFRDQLEPPPSVSAGAARRLIGREQRAAERHAANLIVLARYARYQADCAAVAEGRELPPAPLVSLRDLDFPALNRFFSEVVGQVARERERASGLLTADSETVASQRRFAERIDRIMPAVVAALDRAVAAAPGAAALAGLLPAAPTGDDRANDRLIGPPPESTAPKQSAPADSQSPHQEKNDSIDAAARRSCPAPPPQRRTVARNRAGTAAQGSGQ